VGKQRRNSNRFENHTLSSHDQQNTLKNIHGSSTVQPAAPRFKKAELPECSVRSWSENNLLTNQLHPGLEDVLG
jgi:hypothetical protein